jgi:hypothetical protein
MIRKIVYVFFAASSAFFFSACATNMTQNVTQSQENYRQPSGQPQDILNTIEDWHNQCLAAGNKDCRINITALAEGWQVEIGVSGISKAVAPQPLPGFKMNSRNWMECQVDPEYFKAKGGKNNLLDIMNAFYQWMRQESNGKK